MAYEIYAHNSGVTISADAKTLAGAKREASAWITFGGGSVTVIENGEALCTRELWSSLGRFGWRKWTAAN